MDFCLGKWGIPEVRHLVFRILGLKAQTKSKTFNVGSFRLIYAAWPQIFLAYKGYGFHRGTITR